MLKPILASVLTLVPLSAVAQDVTLRLAHVLREGDPAFTVAETFKAEVERASEGRIEVMLFPAGQLGDNDKLFAQIQSGAIDLSFTPYFKLSDIEPSFNVIGAGFMFPSWNSLEAVLEAPDLGGTWTQSVLDKGGLRVLAPFFYGTRNLTTTDVPVRSPADLAGLKIRAVPNPMSLANVRGLGAAPTPVAWPETYQALRQGTVDGQENPVPVLYAAKFYEVQKYLTRTDHQMGALPVLIREASFQDLSEADRKVVTDAARVAADAGTTAMQDLTESLVADMEAKGMIIIDLTDAEKAAFRERSRAILMDEIDGTVIPEGVIARVEAFVAQSG